MTSFSGVQGWLTRTTKQATATIKAASAKRGGQASEAAPGEADAAQALPAPEAAATTVARDAAADTALAEADAAAPEGPTPEGGAPEAVEPEGLPEEGPVAELIVSMETLEQIMADETKQLTGKDPAAMRDIQKRKLQAAVAYEVRVRGLKEDPAPLQALSESARAELQARMRSFDATVRQNARTINAARAIAEELLHKTVDIIKRHRRESNGYAPDGLRREESERLTAPVTVNKNL
jgi:hypothetical protein